MVKRRKPKMEAAAAFWAAAGAEGGIRTLKEFHSSRE